MATQVFKLFIFKGENQFLPFNHLIFYFISGTVWTQQGKRECIYLTPLYHFHPLHKHLDISQTITAESSTLYKASSRNQTGNFWFPSASLQPLSYTPSNGVTAYVHYVYHSSCILQLIWIMYITKLHALEQCTRSSARWQLMYITSNTLYSLTHLMTLVSIYTPEIFDLIPGYNFRVVCRCVKSPHLLTNPLIIGYPPIFRIFLTPQLHDISSFL